MREFFTGKNVKLLTDDREISGIRVWHMNLEKNELGHMACRLEDAVTFVYVARGTMKCQINQERIEMESGEGVFINSRNAYRFLSCARGGCELYVAVIDEDYLKVDEMTTEKYITPVVENEALFHLKLESEKREPEAVLDCLDEIGAAAEAREPGYELEIKSLVLRMWMYLYKEFAEVFCAPKKAELKEKIKLYKMLEFLHIHYKEKITLGEMAENSGVSTGEYCRFFKKRMEQTPFEYLQAYRIERSLPEILDKSDSITKIALKHGFTGSSYYAETFKKEMGCAPGDYRKWYRGEVSGECPLKQVNEEQPVKKVEKQEPVRVRRESMPAHLL